MSKLYQAINNFDLEYYVNNTFNTIKEANGSNLRINCFSPNGCGGTDYKQHLWVDVENRIWHCFKCGYGSHKLQPGTNSLIQFIQDAEDIPKYKAIETILSSSKPIPSSDLMCQLEKSFNKRKKKKNKIIQFPDSFLYTRDFPDYALKYMLRRGFSEECLRLYGTRFQPHTEDNDLLKWSRRIVFPIYDLEGRMISAAGRLIEPVPRSYFGRTRWTNWSNSNMQFLMWPLGTYEDSIWIGIKDLEPDHIILCEGVNDAHAITELTGIKALAMFGKKLSDPQIQVLTNIAPDHVTLAFDYEAINKIERLATNLVGRFKKVTVFPFIWDGWKKYDFGNMTEIKNSKIPFINILNKEFNNLVDVSNNSFLKWITALKLA
jgi:hypothetical protein